MKQRINKLNPRYNFPDNDQEIDNAYIDKRSEIEIFKQIIHTINREINNDLKQVYEKMLQRSPTTKEISKEGITKTAQELQKEVAMWKKANLISTPEAKEMTSAILESSKNNIALIDNLDTDKITPLPEPKTKNTKDIKCESNKCINEINTEETKNQIMFIKNILHHENNTNLSKKQITEKNKLKQKYDKEIRNWEYTLLSPPEQPKRISNHNPRSLYKIISLIEKNLNIPYTKPKDITIQLTKIKEKLVHISGTIINKHNTKPTFDKFLIDSGSSDNIIPYKTYKSLNLDKFTILDCTTQYNIRSSSGMTKNGILGTTYLPISILTKNNKIITSKPTKFLIANKTFNLDENILGNQFLKQHSINIDYGKNPTKITGTFGVFTNNSIIPTITTLAPASTNPITIKIPNQTPKNCIIKLTKHIPIQLSTAPIQINTSQLIPNSNVEILKHNFNTPIKNHSAINKFNHQFNFHEITTNNVKHTIKLKINSPNQKEPQEEKLQTSTFTNPKNTPTKSNYLTDTSSDEDQPNYENYESTNEDTSSDLSSAKDQPTYEQHKLKHPNTCPNHLTDTSSDEDQPEYENYTTKKDTTIKVYKTTRKKKYKKIKQETNTSEDTSSEELDHKNPKQDPFQKDKTNNILYKFESQSQQAPTATDIILDKAYNDLDINSETNILPSNKPKLLIKKELLNQLNDFQTPDLSQFPIEDQTKYFTIISRYKLALAENKHACGNFNGFQVRLPTDETISCRQKQRKLVNSKEISDTIENLKANDVISLSTGLQEKYLANLNLVLKAPEDSLSKSPSKADKHVQKFNQIHNEPKTYRATVDYTSLNKALLDLPAFTTPSISEIREFCRGKLLTSMDIANAFFAIEINREDRPKTNFYFHNQVYCFNRLVQGAKNSPAFLQRALNCTFTTESLKRFLVKYNIRSKLTPDSKDQKTNKNTESTTTPSQQQPPLHFTTHKPINTPANNENKLNSEENTKYIQSIIGNTTNYYFPYSTWEEFLLIFADDILIAIDKNDINHKNTSKLLLSLVLETLAESGWKIKGQSMKIEKTKLKFVGQIIDTEENYSILNTDRVQAMASWRAPRSLAELSSRLSTLNYYESFLPYCKLIALPLYELILSNTWKWEKVHAEAFSCIKLLCAIAIKNYNPDKKKRIIISTDASKNMAAYAIFQIDENGKWHIIACGSKLFSGADLRKPIVFKELLAIILALKTQEHLLRSIEADIILFTDSHPLSYLHRTKCYSSTLFESAIFLTSFPRLKIVFVSGQVVCLADILSRQFYDIILKSNQTISKEWSGIPPPIPNLDGIQIGHEQLSQWILSQPAPEQLYDVHAKHKNFRQPINLSKLNNHLSICPSDMAFHIGVSALQKQWNSTEFLNIPIWKELAKTNNLTETSQHHLFRLEKLKDFIESLEKSPHDEKFLNHMMKKYAEAAKLEEQEMSNQITNKKGTDTERKPQKNKKAKKIKTKSCNSTKTLPTETNPGSSTNNDSDTSSSTDTENTNIYSATVAPINKRQSTRRITKKRIWDPSDIKKLPKQFKNTNNNSDLKNKKNITPSHKIPNKKIKKQKIITNNKKEKKKEPEIKPTIKSKPKIISPNENESKTEEIQSTTPQSTNEDNKAKDLNNLNNHNPNTEDNQDNHNPDTDFQLYPNKEEINLHQNITNVLNKICKCTNDHSILNFENHHTLQTENTLATLNNFENMNNYINKINDFTTTSRNNNPENKKALNNPTIHQENTYIPQDPESSTILNEKLKLYFNHQCIYNKARLFPNIISAFQDHIYKMTLNCGRNKIHIVPIEFKNSYNESLKLSAKDIKNNNKTNGQFNQSLEIITKQHIILEPFMSNIIKMTISIQFNGLLEFKPHPQNNLVFYKSEVFEGQIFHIQNITLISFNEQPVTIPANTTLASILFFSPTAEEEFDDKLINMSTLPYTQNLLFLNIPMDSIKEHNNITNEINKKNHQRELIDVTEEFIKNIDQEKITEELEKPEENLNFTDQDKITEELKEPTENPNVTNSNLINTIKLKTKLAKERINPNIEQYLARITDNKNLTPKKETPKTMPLKPNLLNPDTLNNQRQFLNKLLLNHMFFTNSGIIDNKFLHHIQMSDEYLAKKIKEIKNNKTKTKNFFIDHRTGLLFKETKSELTNYNLLCLDDILTKEIILHFHNKLHYHYKTKAIINLFQTLFYNKNISSIAQTSKKECCICIILKHKQYKQIIGHNRSYNQTHPKPGQTWHADTLTLPRSSAQYKYMLVLVEDLSSYIVCSPLKTLTAIETIKFLQTFLSIMPTPSLFRTDGSTQFKNEQVTSLLNKHGIKHEFSRPLNPSSNGSAEAAVKLVKQQLRNIIFQMNPKTRDHWHMFIPTLVNSVNCHPAANSLLARNQLLFNPYISTWTNSTPKYQDILFSPQLLQLQENEAYQKLSERRKRLAQLHQIPNTRIKTQSTLVPGSYAILNRKPDEHIIKESKNRSSALVIERNKIFKILKYTKFDEKHKVPYEALVLNLNNGKEEIITMERLNPISISDGLSFHLALENLEKYTDPKSQLTTNQNKPQLFIKSTNGKYNDPNPTYQINSEEEKIHSPEEEDNKESEDSENEKEERANDHEKATTIEVHLNKIKLCYTNKQYKLPHANNLMGLSHILTTTPSTNTIHANTTIETHITRKEPIKQAKTKPKTILKQHIPRKNTTTLEELQEKLESLPEPLVKSLKKAIKNRADIQKLSEPEILILKFERSKNTNYAAYPTNQNYNERIIKTVSKIQWAPHIQENELAPNDHSKIIQALKTNAFQIAVNKSDSYNSIKCLTCLKNNIII